MFGLKVSPIDRYSMPWDPILVNLMRVFPEVNHSLAMSRGKQGYLGFVVQQIKRLTLEAHCTV